MFFAPRQRRAGTPAEAAGGVPVATATAGDDRADAAASAGAAPGDDADPAAQWLQRLAGGDFAALDSLYRRESARVYRYALAVCGNAAWAADATQDAFIALATRPQGFDPARGQIGAYLAGVARHALSARWRELRREVPHDASHEAAHGASFDAAQREVSLDEDALPEPRSGAIGNAATPEQLLVRAQEVQALWAALRRLPVVFREAVVLVDLQERPYAEAAQIAGIELNTLRTRLHRARSRLAALLGAPGAPTASAADTSQGSRT
jgi:RNA polymerase sigma-70 factor (ECF subfamily)